MRHILSIFRGEKSLGATYWLYYILPSIVGVAFFYGIIITTASLSDTPALQKILTYLARGFLIVVIYGCGIAVIRSAWQGGRAGFWGWVASAVVIFNAFRFIAELAGISTYSQSERDAETKKQVALINAGLPKKIDAITTLIRLSFADKIYTYHYKIDESFSGTVDVARIKGKGINDMCENWKSVLTSGELESVEYRYLIKGQAKSFFITKSDCF